METRTAEISLKNQYEYVVTDNHYCNVIKWLDLISYNIKKNSHIFLLFVYYCTVGSTLPGTVQSTGEQQVIFSTIQKIKKFRLKIKFALKGL